MSDGITFNNSLNVFEQRKLDSSVESITYAELKPITSGGQSGPYEFAVEASQDPIALDQVLLKVECKITKADGTVIAADETVGPVCNILHSMFEKVDVSLNGKSVSHHNSLYAYRAYMEELLFADVAEKDGRLFMQGFVLDSAGRHSVADPEAAIPNEGLKTRRDQFFSRSRRTLLIGGLHCDIFRQKKYLIDNVSMRIVLHRAPDAFFLIKAGATDYKLVINNMSLMVPFVKTGEAMRRSLEATLGKRMSATYNIDRTTMHTHLIPAGVTSFNIPSLFRGHLPHTVVLAMCSNANRRADTAVNPLFFEEYNASKIAL